MSLYTKHRPVALRDVVGNDSVKESIESCLAKQDRPHAFLLTGPSGCGKTTIARIMASRLGANPFDIAEINAADFRGVDTVRDIVSKMHLVPSGDARVWIIDECHKLTSDAQSAFLKALEDTPRYTYFILATTDRQKLLNTIITRCTAFALQSLDQDLLMRLLLDVTQKEQKVVDEGVLEDIALSANGSARMALVLLDSVIDLPKEAQEQAIAKKVQEESQAIDLCRALAQKAPWKTVATILKGLEVEPETVRRICLGYAQSLLLSKDNPHAYLMLEAFQKPLYDVGKPGLTYACYQICKA